MRVSTFAPLMLVPNDYFLHESINTNISFHCLQRSPRVLKSNDLQVLLLWIHTVESFYTFLSTSHLGDHRSARSQIIDHRSMSTFRHLLNALQGQFRKLYSSDPPNSMPLPKCLTNYQGDAFTARENLTLKKVLNLVLLTAWKIMILCYDTRKNALLQKTALSA